VVAPTFEEVSLTIRQILFFGFWMSVIMALCMAFMMAAINVGFNRFFLTAWLSGWGIGFLVLLPLSFIIPPTLQKLMKRFKI
jgi:hypothetical protein